MVNYKEFTGKNVLITGGLGFIGSSLARRLVELNATVTLVDSLIPQYGGNMFNIDDNRDRLIVNITDVWDPYAMAYLIQGQDFLFDLSCQASHTDSIIDPQTDLDINASAQLSILEARCKHDSDVKIVLAGARQLYGKPAYLHVDEKHPIKPVDMNGINKLAGRGDQ